MPSDFSLRFPFPREVRVDGKRASSAIEVEGQASATQGRGLGGGLLPGGKTRSCGSNRRGSFFEFFSHLFFARKIDALKLHFPPHFWRILAIFAPKIGDLGSILGAWGRLFVTILLIESKLHFSTFFLILLLDF